MSEATSPDDDCNLVDLLRSPSVDDFILWSQTQPEFDHLANWNDDLLDSLHSSKEVNKQLSSLSLSRCLSVLFLLVSDTHIESETDVTEKGWIPCFWFLFFLWFLVFSVLSGFVLQSLSSSSLLFFSLIIYGFTNGCWSVLGYALDFTSLISRPSWL